VGNIDLLGWNKNQTMERTAFNHRVEFDAKKLTAFCASHPKRYASKQIKAQNTLRKIKALAISISLAILLTAIQFLAAIKISSSILWQVTTVQWSVALFLGPGPLLGYDASGQPMYEGTPIHMVAAYIGLLFGAIVYSIIIHKIMKRLHNQ
jgi:hypothetical protein